MLHDADRLQQTVEQVLKAGVARQRVALQHRGPVDIGGAVAGMRRNRARCGITSPPRRIAIVGSDCRRPLVVNGDVDELRTRVCEPARQRGEVFARASCRSRSRSPAPTPDTVVGARQGSRRRHSAARSSKRIFNRFYRFQPRGSKVKGTGLGLYIVRSIVKQHGGRVFAESDGEGKGATFTLELPRLVRTQ